MNCWDLIPLPGQRRQITVLLCPEKDADAVLAAIKANPNGKDAAVIGEVAGDHAGKVFMETRIGGERIVDMLAGEQLPRIC